jgi:protein-S-isoprenylcysteine O-methyltransferase Ste14
VRTYGGTLPSIFGRIATSTDGAGGWNYLSGAETVDGRGYFRSVNATGPSFNIRALRWSNVPAPEGHLALLGLSLVLERTRSRPMETRLSGWPVVATGGALAAWAVRSAGDIDLNNPARLIVEGPYRWSRHPMYVAWTLLYLGVALILRSRRPLILFPGLAWWVRREALGEEAGLIARFGDAYRRYEDRVPRFI